MASMTLSRNRGLRVVAVVVIGVGYGVLRLGVGAAGATPRTPARSALSCDGHAATIVGTSGNDVISGTAGSDVIVALGGNDVVHGGGGRDYICGGSGNDTLSGGPGNDQIDGNGGDDTENGGSGNDDLHGGNGDDTLDGGTGSDNEDGGSGNDVLESDGDDTLESDGNDTIDCQGDDPEETTNCQDEIAQEMLLEGLDDAADYRFSNNDSYAGFDAAAGSAIDPEITWQDGGASIVGVVSVKDVTDTQVLLTTQSASGTYACAADSPSGTSEGTGSTDFSTVASCTGGNQDDEQ